MWTFLSFLGTCMLLLNWVTLSCSFLMIGRRGKYGMLGAPPPTNDPLPPDQWLTQLLDHFEPTSSTTWQQRYQVVTEHYEEGGPVFLFIGGEGLISERWMVNGAWVKYAKQNDAMMFQLEHRYYGKSQPTSDLSVENLQYLSSEQALADIAYFITAMNTKHKLPAGTKWIAFGGSYAGNLAAWVRYKYPHLVHAAVSSSAPLLAKVDFVEYMEVVKNSLGTYSDKCVEAVAAANKQVNMLLKHPIGQQSINKEFRLCDPIDASNIKDVTVMLRTLARNIIEVVQYNKDNMVFDEGFNGGIRPTIDSLCDIMVNESMGTPMIRYAAVNRLLMSTEINGCLHYKYEEIIELTKITSLDFAALVPARQWVYQTCTEFGYYQTAESNQGLFGKDFPVEFFIQKCADIYGERFTKEMVKEGVTRSNILYGGLDAKATRVVYVHGSIDPWHALGITKTRIPESPAIFINGTAHCADMYPPASTDLPALTAAREKISALIQKWLQES